MYHPVRKILLATAAWAVLGCGGLLSPETWLTTPTPPPSASWVGVWTGTGMRVEIGADGVLDVEQQTDNSAKHFTAPATTWETAEPASVTVGIGPILTTYTIEQPPHEVDGQWRMVFNGVVLVRETQASDFNQGFEPADSPPPPEPSEQ